MDVDEVAQHLLADLEVGDHAVLQRADRLDGLGATIIRLASRPTATGASIVDVDGDDGGLVEDDALTVDVDQRVGGAQFTARSARG